MKALRDYFEAMRHQPFAFGENDCALFAAGWIRTVKGFDPAEGYRGEYQSEDEAFDIIRDEGGLLQLCKNALGEPYPINLGRTGDIAYKEQDGMECVGIIQSAYVYTPHDKGIVRTPLSGFDLVFRI